ARPDPGLPHCPRRCAQTHGMERYRRARAQGAERPHRDQCRSLDASSGKPAMNWLCEFAFIASLFSACTPYGPATLSGYVEGEYVLAAPVATARIVRVAVRRGDRVQKAALLAELDSEDAKLTLQQAEARLAEARAQYANMSK